MVPSRVGVYENTKEFQNSFGPLGPHSQKCLLDRKFLRRITLARAGGWSGPTLPSGPVPAGFWWSTVPDEVNLTLSFTAASGSAAAPEALHGPRAAARGARKYLLGNLW